MKPTIQALRNVPWFSIVWSAAAVVMSTSAWALSRLSQ